MLYQTEFGNHFYFSHKIGNADVKQNPANYAEHMHQEYELLYFVRGEGQLVLEQRVYAMKPGYLMLIRPGEHHQIQVNEMSAYERIIVNFSPENFPEVLLTALGECANMYDALGTPLGEMLIRLDTHYMTASGEMRNELMKAALTEILIYLCYSDRKILSADMLSENLEQVLTYINENLTRIHSLDDITGSMHMSKSCLCKLFTDCMHVPIMSYVRTKKCMLARSMIQRGEKPMDIYEKCGFKSYSAFFRAYLKANEQSPTENRRRERKG